MPCNSIINTKAVDLAIKEWYNIISGGKTKAAREYYKNNTKVEITLPIKIPNDLPAFSALEKERIFVIPNDRAAHQDIRALKIAILNLMPDKITTETQLLRLLSNTPLHVDIDLVQMSSHVSKTTSQEHMLAFYKPFEEVEENRYDGLIITGAPVELIDFEEVDYWEELRRAMDWSIRNVYSTIHICWGAQAALHYHYGIPKYTLESKMFGNFKHHSTKPDALILKGFGDVFHCPHSRHTEVRKEDIDKVPELSILAESNEAGVQLICDKTERLFFQLGHWEYDRETLANEYFRDVRKGLKIAVPYHYFPDDDPENKPVFNWSCSANLLYSNWLNYCVYQKTPYDLKDLEPVYFSPAYKKKP